MGPFSGFIKFSMNTSNRMSSPGAGVVNGLRLLREGLKRMWNWMIARKLRQTISEEASKEKGQTAQRTHATV